MPKKNFKSRLDKQALFQVRIEEVACCLSTQRYFNVIIVLILKATWQSCIKIIILIFEEQKQSTPIQLLWNPLTKSRKNSCFEGHGCSWASRPWTRIGKLGKKIWGRFGTKWTTQKIIYAYHEAKKAIKLDIIELDKYERDHKKEVLSENGLCRYLYQLDEEQGDREKKLMTICEVKIHRDITESLKSQAIAFSCSCKMDLRELSYVKNWCLFQRIPKYLISG